MNAKSITYMLIKERAAGIEFGFGFLVYNYNFPYHFFSFTSLLDTY